MKKLLLLLVLLTVALAGGAYWASHAQKGRTAEERYTLMPIEYGSMIESVSATGLLHPQETIAVGSELSGRVVEIFPNADFNKIVYEGDPLLRIDDSMARLRVDEAQIALNSAETDLMRVIAMRQLAEVSLQQMRELRSAGGVRQGEVDKAEKQLNVAQIGEQAAKIQIDKAAAALKQAKLALDMTVVKVPTSNGSAGGRKAYTVLDRKVVLGQLVAPPASGHLFTLASDLEHMQVHAQVAEGDIGKVFPNMAAQFTVSTSADEEVHFRGKVVEVRLLPTNSHAAVFYPAVIDVRNERDPVTGQWRLRPGMTASVDLIRREHANVWKMPSAALGFQPDARQLSEAAQAKLARWEERSDALDWKPVWVLDHSRQPWPVFVRLGGKNAQGEPGIKDVQFSEVLEWDPELEKRPDPRDPAAMLRVIIAGPPAEKGGLFKMPPIRF